MRRFFRTLARLLLVALLLASVFAAFWFGVVPQRMSPFAPLTLDQPAQWFVDPKLAALRRDPALCQAVLKTPHIEAVAIPDLPFENGCGARNSVRVSTVGGARLPADRISCEVAAALALWLEYDVQPLAVSILGQRVQSVLQMGTYSCRNIIGNPFWKGVRSQHASANAIDIGGFMLADGRQISVLKNWNGGSPEGRFLREVHARACHYFRVVLGPDFNVSHKDHFHFDRGPLWTCR